MKNYVRALIFFLLASGTAWSQAVIFSDDFESGSGNWDVTGTWGVTMEHAHAGLYSFTDSPGGDYGDLTTTEADLHTGVDLSTALDADIQFYALIDLEEGFDYVYLDASGDGGATWTNLGSFNGEGMLTDWIPYTFPLGAFVGNSDVKVRFRFVSDAGTHYDGMYIDDITINTYDVDNTPPLILHTPGVLYEGTLNDNPLDAELIDPSGISATDLYYSVDGGAWSSVSGVNTTGDHWLYDVPAQDPGAWVDYYIAATDDYVTPNSDQTDTFHYIAGNYISYDNAEIDFVQDIGDLSAAGYLSTAVKVSLGGPTTLAAVVLQNYTDIMRPNDDMLVHIWNDAGGLPGTDIIPPITVTPEATLAEPNKGTRVDLRPYAADLSGISGDIYIGYSVPGGVTWLSETSPGIGNHTYVQTATGWLLLSVDFHFRAITAEIEGAPAANFSYDAVASPAIAFTDLSTNTPDAWSWDFGDGTTDDIQNPSHTFLTNGDFNVCLTASNVAGSDTHCEIVSISDYAEPAADFSWTGDPDVSFTDMSANFPTSWSWDFGDGGTSTTENPSHTFTANGTYTVCLDASNAEGEDTVCKAVTISGNPEKPVADFSYNAVDLTVSFSDLSTNTPTYWTWTFGDGNTSTAQNPSHTYAEGNYTVCLNAGNVAGSDDTCKVIAIGTAIQQPQIFHVDLYPDPASENIFLSLPQPGMEIIIRNVTGQVVKTLHTESAECTVSVGDLPQGYYLLEATGTGRDGSTTFVISR